MNSSVIIILALMLTTLLVLGIGLGTMVIGGEFNRRYGNKLMMARVGLQAVTIIVVGLLFFAR